MDPALTRVILSESATADEAKDLLLSFSGAGGKAESHPLRAHLTADALLNARMPGRGRSAS